MLRALITLIAVLAAPRLALACPVCFGQSDSPMAMAMNSGIMLMVGVFVAVLGGFAAFIIYLMRRAKVFADEPAAADSSYPGTNPQEGTARC